MCQKLLANTVIEKYEIELKDECRIAQIVMAGLSRPPSARLRAVLAAERAWMAASRRHDGGAMKSAVIVFPASNCDRDAATALEQITGNKTEMVWHQDSELPDGIDLVVLPGGFSYGDYLQQRRHGRARRTSCRPSRPMPTRAARCWASATASRC